MTMHKQLRKCKLKPPELSHSLWLSDLPRRSSQICASLTHQLEPIKTKFISQNERYPRSSTYQYGNSSKTRLLLTKKMLSYAHIYINRVIITLLGWLHEIWSSCNMVEFQVYMLAFTGINQTSSFSPVCRLGCTERTQAKMTNCCIST